MSYPDSFYAELVRDAEEIGHRSIVRQSFPPTIPTFSREAMFSMSMRYGETGSGKTVSNCHWVVERHGLGFKVVWFDTLKAEMACACLPMTQDHPLFPIITQAGLKPESFPTEILQPLVFIRGQPALLYEQPNIVKPFTISLSDLALTEWMCLFPGGLSPGQINLHDQALKEVYSHIESVTMHDLYVKVQEILERGKVGYGTHIEGMEATPTIQMSKKVFGGREAQGLLQKYQVLLDTSLIMPSKWNGDRVKTNIDIQKILKNQKTISVIYIPQYKDLPHLNMGIINYILNHIVHLKDPNNPNRVSTPTCLAFPELKTFCPKHIPEQKRYFIEPIKNTLLELVSLGAGMGIAIDADTQFWRQIPDEYRANITTSFVFDLGEQASEKIREIVKGRFVSNFKEITDDYHLSALKEPGTFIFLGYGRRRAEIRRNALVGFWYPRARTSDTETETNYYNLYKRFRPKEFVDISPLYMMLLKINVESQTKAAERMDAILMETEEKKKLKKKEKQRQIEKLHLTTLNTLIKIAEEEKVKFFEYGKISSRLAPIINRSVTQTQRILKKFHEKGWIYIDRSQGAKKQKVILNMEQINKVVGCRAMDR